MKTLIALTLALAGITANAFDFAAATDGTYVCSNYCSGYTTSDSAKTVDYVNMVYSGQQAVPSGYTNAYTLVLSINGVTYRKYGVIYPDVSPFVATDVAGSGATITATVKYNAVRLGCGRYCTRTNYRVTGGSVVLP